MKTKNDREEEMSPSRKCLLEGWDFEILFFFFSQFKLCSLAFFSSKDKYYSWHYSKVLSIIPATFSQNSIPSNIKNSFVFQNFQNPKCKEWKIIKDGQIHINRPIAKDIYFYSTF